MKFCKTCKQEKPFSATAKYCSKASGFYAAACWDCYLAVNAKAANAKRRSTPDGLAKHNAANVKFRATTVGRVNTNAASLAYAKKYPAKVNARNAKRYTAKLRRMPPWADLEAIKQVYAEAAQRGLTVDHIYPLRGKLVSGLHVANNLQLLTKSENSSKGNRLQV